MNLKDIKSLIQFVFKSGVYEVNINIGNTKIHIKNKPTIDKNILSSSVELLQPKNVLSNSDIHIDSFEKDKKEKENVESQYTIIKSPMIGTFYIRPSPDKDPYVKIGDQIQSGSKICVIEAMKLFNEIESEISGKIIKILVEDASPVEYDQSLFLIDPS